MASKKQINWVSGARFGKLVLVEKTQKKVHRRRPVWLCRCDCGRLVEKADYNIRRAKVPMCDDCRGSKNAQCEPGRKIGNLTLVKKTQKKVYGRRPVWLCRCKCGRLIEKADYNLRRAKVPMCDYCRGKAVLKPGMNVFNLKLVDVFISKNGVRIWLCECSCGWVGYVEDVFLRPVARELRTIQGSLVRSCNGFSNNNMMVECLSLIRNIKRSIKGETNG